MASFNIPKVGPPPVIGTYRKLGFSPQAEPVPTTPEFGPGTQQGFLEDLGTGFQVGTVQAAEMAGSFLRDVVGAGFLRSIGADKLAEDWEAKTYLQNIQTGLSIQRLEREVGLPIRIDDPDSVGGAMQWGMYTIAKQAPQFALQFGTAIVAHLLGLPGAAAFWGTSFVLGAGEVYSQALAETGEPNRLAASAAGIAIAFVEMTPYGRVFRKMGKGAQYGSYMGRKLAFGRSKNTFLSYLSQMGVNGTAEAATE